MRVVFSNLARNELKDARRHYDLEYGGLGQNFEDEVRHAVFRILEFPHAWSVETGEIRKCLLHRFPYKLLYSVETDHIFIIAVAHQHRKPEYWIDREPG